MLGIRPIRVVQTTGMELEESRPASRDDVLDAKGVMREILHIVDDRALNRLIVAEGLPVHRGSRQKRLFIRGEVLDWLMFRCTSPAPDQTAAS